MDSVSTKLVEMVHYKNWAKLTSLHAILNLTLGHQNFLPDKNVSVIKWLGTICRWLLTFFSMIETHKCYVIRPVGQMTVNFNRTLQISTRHGRTLILLAGIDIHSLTHHPIADFLAKLLGLLLYHKCYACLIRLSTDRENRGNCLLFFLQGKHKELCNLGEYKEYTGNLTWCK